MSCTLYALACCRHAEMLGGTCLSPTDAVRDQLTRTTCHRASSLLQPPHAPLFSAGLSPFSSAGAGPPSSTSPCSHQTSGEWVPGGVAKRVAVAIYPLRKQLLTCWSLPSVTRAHLLTPHPLYPCLALPPPLLQDRRCPWPLLWWLPRSFRPLLCPLSRRHSGGHRALRGERGGVQRGRQRQRQGRGRE
jgi:hypothetical protein